MIACKSLVETLTALQLISDAPPDAHSSPMQGGEEYRIFTYFGDKFVIFDGMFVSAQAYANPEPIISGYFPDAPLRRIHLRIRCREQI